MQSQTDSPENTPEDRRGMGSLLDLDHYAKYESGHPGFDANIENIITKLKQLHKKHKGPKPFTILEMGAGPGNPLTEALGTEFAENGCKVFINEYDEHSVSRLRNKHNCRTLSQKLEILPSGDINKWMEEQIASGKKHCIDAIVSNFAMHHLIPFEPAGELTRFFRNASQLLKPSGYIVSGEEFLDPHLPAQSAKHTSIHNSADMRAAIQIAYHGRVIEKAWSEGKIILPGLEYQALVSGLKTTTEFFPQDSKLKETKCNEEAVKLLNGLIHRLEKRMEHPFTDWDNIEKDAAKISGLTVQEARENCLYALKNLSKSLEHSPVAGLRKETETVNPTSRNLENIPGIDRKITAEAYAHAAAQAGFRTKIRFTGAHPHSFRNEDQSRINPMGGVAVAASRRLGSSTACNQL